MGQISDSYKPVTATVLSQSYGGDKQLLWVEPPQTDPEAVGWLHSSWLDGYAYSTLPVKGEESLVSSTASSASPNHWHFAAGSAPRQLHKHTASGATGRQRRPAWVLDREVW